MRTAWALLFAVALPACVLLTPLAGLSDGAAPDADAARAEAETSSPDNASTTDGPRLSESESESAAPGLDHVACKTALICDDFERVNPQGEWDSLSSNAGGVVETTTDTYASGARSLHTYVPAGSDDALAFVTRFDVAMTAHASASFAMKTPAVPDRDVQFTKLTLFDATRRRNYAVALSLTGSDVIVSEQVFDDTDPAVSSASYVSYSVPGLTPGVFQRWSVELDASTSPAVVAVAVDGTTQLRTKLRNTVAPGLLTVNIGPSFLRDGPGRHFWFDNVMVRTLP